MMDPEIESRRDDIAEAIKQHEAHTWRDHEDFLLLREQGSLLANLVWQMLQRMTSRLESRRDSLTSSQTD
jgi:hypothetical protein